MRALGRAHGPMRDTLLSTLRAGRQASRSLPQIGLRVAQEIPGLRASSSASVAKSMRVRSAWSGTLSLFKGAKPLTWEGGPSSMPDRRPGGPALPLQPARFDSAVNSRDCVLLFSREFAANDGDLRDFFAALHLGWQPRSGTNRQSTAIHAWAAKLAREAGRASRRRRREERQRSRLRKAWLVRRQSPGTDAARRSQAAALPSRDVRVTRGR